MPLRPHGETSQSATKVRGHTGVPQRFGGDQWDVYAVIRTYHMYMRTYEYRQLDEWMDGWMDGWTDRKTVSSIGIHRERYSYVQRHASQVYYIRYTYIHIHMYIYINLEGCRPGPPANPRYVSMHLRIDIYATYSFASNSYI